MKRCTKCGKEKDESEFYKDKRRMSGLTDHCKKCINEYYKARRIQYKETIRKKNKRAYNKYKKERQEKRKERNERIFEFDIKPWKDPESLFCDTGFLENMLGKEITKGKECKS